MTMVGTNVALPNRPRSLLRFLALWLASYLAPMFATSVVAFLIPLTAYRATPDAGQWPLAIVWLVLLPTSIAFGQWLLMRRYLLSAALLVAATAAAALLAQLSNLFVPILTPDMLGDMPQLFGIFEILARVFGSRSR
jgi:hypothetical protein